MPRKNALTLASAGPTLKIFFRGTVFRLYFQNTMPRKNTLTLARAHAHQRSRSPALAQHLKSFSVAQYFDFMRE
jgi:hypothetical protein